MVTEAESSGSSQTQQQTRRRLPGALWLLIALAGMGLILFLNVRKPIWLAPPWFHYTPFVYAALALGWLPVLAVALSRLVRRRWLVVLTVCLVMVQFIGCIFAPDVYIDLIDLGLWGGSPPMGGLGCRDESASGIHTLHRCELCVGSSDNPQTTVRTYQFRVFAGWPVMWLDEAGTSYRVGYSSCESVW